MERTRCWHQTSAGPPRSRPVTRGEAPGSGNPPRALRPWGESRGELAPWATAGTHAKVSARIRGGPSSRYVLIPGA